MPLLPGVDGTSTALDSCKLWTITSSAIPHSGLRRRACHQSHVPAIIDGNRPSMMVARTRPLPPTDSLLTSVAHSIDQDTSAFDSCKRSRARSSELARGELRH